MDGLTALATASAMIDFRRGGEFQYFGWNQIQQQDACRRQQHATLHIVRFHADAHQQQGAAATHRILLRC
jgi:hypothetical protein